MRQARTPALWAVLFVGIGFCGPANAGAAGTRKVTGRVIVQTTDTFALVSGATVRIEAVASMYGGVVEEAPDRFPLGPRAVVTSNKDGVYTATLDIPDGIPAKHLYAQLIAADLKTGSGTAHVLVPLVGTGDLKQDLFLKFPSGAFVKGVVRDKRTGERLRAVTVSAAILFSTGGGRWLTDADGEYFGLLYGVGTEPTDTIFFVPGYQPFNMKNGIRYQPVSRTQRTVSGKLQVVNFELVPSASQLSVVGRLINATTGAPIANALVEARLSDGWGSHSHYALSDLYGRYQLMTAAQPQGASVRSLVVRTNGAYLAFDDPTAPFQGSTSDLTGRVIEGDVYQHDLALVPRQ